MRALVWLGEDNFEIQNIDLPKLKDEQVLVSVEKVGLCGTDVHITQGLFPSNPPKILGHEFSGIVVDSGEADIAEGVRVTCDPNTWCGACSQCQRGRVNLCPNNIATGIHRDGGFAVKRITLSKRFTAGRWNN